MTLTQEKGAPTHDSRLNLTETLGEVLDNCRCLARYAVETDQLPASVDVKRLYKIRRAFEAQGHKNITEEDFAFLVHSYATLERRLGPVNTETLHATEDIRDESGKVSPSVARKYVRHLFVRTLLIIALVLLGHVTHVLFPIPLTESEPVPIAESEPIPIAASGDAGELHQISEAIREKPWRLAGLMAMFLIPFLYGALGADAFLLRETTHKLHTRQFDPRRIPENRARFLLGSLSGGVIVLFVSPDVLQTPNTVFNVGGAALGFVAGFSTDFLFDIIDRVLRAILPRGGGISSDDVDLRADDELLQRYRHLMNEAESEERKKILKSVVEDLESRARHSG